MKFSKGDKVVIDPKSWTYSSWKDYVFTVLDFYETEQQYAVETPAGFKKLFKAKDLMRENAEVPKFGIGDVVRTNDIGAVDTEFVVNSIYSSETNHAYHGPNNILYHEDNLLLSLKATKSPFRVGDFARVTHGSRYGQIAEIMEAAPTHVSGYYTVRFKDGNRSLYGQSVLGSLSSDVAVGDRVVVLRGLYAGKHGKVTGIDNTTTTIYLPGSGTEKVLVHSGNVRRISRFDAGAKVRIVGGWHRGTEWTVTGQHGADHVDLSSDKGTAVVPVTGLKKVEPPVPTGGITSEFISGSGISTRNVEISPIIMKPNTDSDTLKDIEKQLELANMIAYLEVLNKVHEKHPLSRHDLDMRHELAVKVETRLGFPQY